MSSSPGCDSTPARAASGRSARAPARAGATARAPRPTGRSSHGTPTASRPPGEDLGTALGPDLVALGEPVAPPRLRLTLAPALVVGLHLQRWHRDRLARLVDGHHRQVG